MPRRYDADFKSCVCYFVMEHEVAIKEIVSVFNVSNSSVNNWVNEYKKKQEKESLLNIKSTSFTSLNSLEIKFQELKKHVDLVSKENKDLKKAIRILTDI